MEQFDRENTLARLAAGAFPVDRPDGLKDWINWFRPMCLSICKRHAGEEVWKLRDGSLLRVRLPDYAVAMVDD